MRPDAPRSGLLSVVALPKNSILLRKRDGKRFRLLELLPSTEAPDNASTHFVVIQLDAPRAMPERWSKSRALADIALADLVVEAEAREPINLSSLSPAETRILERRWQLICALEQYGAAIYDEAFRGRIASELAKARIASKPFFYDTVRRYLQGGGGKASLVCRYYRCGAPSKARVAKAGSPQARATEDDSARCRRRHDGAAPERHEASVLLLSRWQQQQEPEKRLHLDAPGVL